MTEETKKTERKSKTPRHPNTYRASRRNRDRAKGGLSRKPVPKPAPAPPGPTNARPIHMPGGKRAKKFALRESRA
jgi:hypothetical protein